MLEGGGKTPILTPVELEDIGFKIVAYPLSLLGVSICAMQVTSCTSLEKQFHNRFWPFAICTCQVYKLKPI